MTILSRNLAILEFNRSTMSLDPIAKTAESDSHIGDVEALLWHDGNVISGGDEGKVKVWTPDLKLIAEFQAHDYPIYHMASEGKNFYTCSNDSTIREWTPNGSGWVLARVLQGHKQPVRRLRMSCGCLYSGDEAGEVWVWQNGQPEGTLNVGEEIWDMFVDKNKIYTVRDRDVVISEFGSNGQVSTYNTLEGRGPLRVSGDKLCFIDRSGMELLVHDNIAKGNPLLGKLQGHSMIINAIIGNPDRFFTAGWDCKVVAWNLEKLSKITEQPVDGYVNTMAMSSVGNLYVGGANGGISALKINF
ncbi:unnamed protein product [Allacma fusca]|uniref:Uncharacterized protein n=1 Tax=Allacma fusca TaxID=39272 RepID=A0A8J2LPX5_9HEXA|nr:unnamed protein product [Allacma fusca]